MSPFGRHGHPSITLTTLKSSSHSSLKSSSQSSLKSSSQSSLKSSSQSSLKSSSQSSLKSSSQSSLKSSSQSSLKSSSQSSLKSSSQSSLKSSSQSSLKSTSQSSLKSSSQTPCCYCIAIVLRLLAHKLISTSVYIQVLIHIIEWLGAKWTEWTCQGSVQQSEDSNKDYPVDKSIVLTTMPLWSTIKCLRQKLRSATN